MTREADPFGMAMHMGRAYSDPCLPCGMCSHTAQAPYFTDAPGIHQDTGHMVEEEKET